MDIKLEFHKDMVKIYETAHKLGYDAKLFRKVISTKGGYEAAKGFISKPGGTTGFTRLYELKRLDLSVENLILQDKYETLFSEQEREICWSRLKEYGFIQEMKPISRNPNWTRDELILALNLYFRVNPSHINDKHPEIIKLSELLNKLPIHPVRPDKEKFRNPSGVYMKLCNFLRLDPNYKGTGLDAGSRLDEEVWNEFSNNKEKLSKTAKAIEENFQEVLDQDNKKQFTVDEEEEFQEGRILTRIHKMRERNTSLVKKKKELILKDFGSLKCEVCAFDFFEFYGDIGSEFIECHHTKPISELGKGQTTKLSELAIVCSNCHRMLHRIRPCLSIEGLKDIVVRLREKNI